jgi:hypothetical protein
VRVLGIYYRGYLKVDILPPTNVMVGHFYSIQESLEAVVTAMKHHLYTCEMMDDTILNCTKTNREQAKTDFFIQGDPGCGYDVEKQLDSRS